MTDLLKESLKSAAENPHGHGTPVESITMVGGLMAYGSSSVLSLCDEFHLHTIVKICRGYGIRLSPELSVNVANLYYGDDQDFLNHQHPADMVVLSYLYYNPAGLDYSDRGSIFHDGLTFQSRHATNPDRWLGALVNTGARYAFNIVGSDRITELPTEFIDRAPYRKLDTTRTSLLEYDFLAR